MRHPAIILPGIFILALSAMFVGSLAAEDQRAYVNCLTRHQSPEYCRLIISGR